MNLPAFGSGSSSSVGVSTLSEGEEIILKHSLKGLHHLNSSELINNGMARNTHLQAVALQSQKELYQFPNLEF